jgi:hypothetical protein
MKPPDRRFWSHYLVALLNVAEEMLGEKVSVTPDGWPTPQAAAILLARFRKPLDMLAQAGDYDITGWSIRFWQPGDFAATHTLTPVIVDPKGIGHSVKALAEGSDEG